ncbi:unnamed protein product [Anisakis simplex]|uniref:Myb domain-containing protein n=1 Tax=Anisakis simplex TaxID=6269 RepID=A0A0M3JC17_ANISI|nr:unnamed protein product [Anisakis simplex]
MVNSNHQLISSNTHFDAFAGPMLITASSSSLNAHFINSSMNADASAFKSRAKRHYRYNNNDNNNNNNNNNNNFNNFNNNDENANIYGGFIEQRVRGNHIPQCPCVINPGSNRCIAYDSRYQAASIEEAIVSFPDFTADPRYLGETIVSE